MTLTKAIAHVRDTQKLYERTAEHCAQTDDAIGHNYYQERAKAMEMVLEEINRLSHELLVAVSQQ